MIRRRPLALAIAFALPLVLAAPAQAQHSLVLSGGGARGLAHAGVLLGIERLGYAPDVVVGTSMGSIIGAMYASGYTPLQIWESVAREDWSQLFAADPVLLGPERKPRRPLLSMAFAQGADPVLGGFIPEAGINRRLTHIFFDAGVRAGNDFDSLPRPFRAVAADLRTGESVVIGRGDLARAIRASMAFPGVFSPVRWGELVLVDGAIADNLPIGVARDLSGAPVIAVDVVRPAGELTEVSALQIGVRALRLLMQNARAGREARDTAELFIAPPMPIDWSEAVFPPDAGPFLAAGYAGALEQLAPTPRTALPQPRLRAAPARLESVAVEGADEWTHSLVRRNFRRALGSYQPARVLERTDALYASGMFHGVWPRVEHDSATGAERLVVRVETTPRATASGALGWDNDRGARGWVALRARARLFSPMELRAAASADPLHRWIASSANFYSAVLPPWTLSAGGHMGETRVRLFDGEDIADRPRIRRTGAWAGAERRDLDLQRAITLLLRADDIDAEAGPGGASFGALLRISALPAVDPLIGGDRELEFEARAGAVAYSRLHAAGDMRLHAGAWRFALVADGAYGDGDLPLDVIPFVGGPRGAPWLRYGELRGATRAFGGIDVAHPFLVSGHVRLRLRTGAAARDPAALADTRWTYGAELATVWTTALGPVTAGGAVGRDERWRVQVGIGADW